MDHNPAWLHQAHGIRHEAHASFQATQVLERAEVPYEIDALVSKPAEVAHVSGLEANVALEGNAIDQYWGCTIERVLVSRLRDGA